MNFYHVVDSFDHILIQNDYDDDGTITISFMTKANIEIGYICISSEEGEELLEMLTKAIELSKKKIHD